MDRVTNTRFDLAGLALPLVHDEPAALSPIVPSGGATC